MEKHTALLIVLAATLILSQGCLEPTVRVNKSGNHSPSENDTVVPPEKKKVNATSLENLTYRLVNEERKEKEFEPLEWNSELAAVAREHSQYLANREENKGFTENINISHVGEDGEKHPHRIEKANIYYTNGSGENVAGISSIDTYYNDTKKPASYLNMSEIGERAVKGWMNSPPHKENILKGKYEETGIGIATDSNGTNYVFTQLFINRAECGYWKGECCNGGCFAGRDLECVDGICRKQ